MWFFPSEFVLKKMQAHTRKEAHAFLYWPVSILLFDHYSRDDSSFCRSRCLPNGAHYLKSIFSSSSAARDSGTAKKSLGMMGLPRPWSASSASENLSSLLPEEFLTFFHAFSDDKSAICVNGSIIITREASQVGRIAHSPVSSSRKRVCFVWCCLAR